MEGRINNCYSSADVSGVSKVGGFSGATLEGRIYNSYSAGGVAGEEFVGGFCGDTSGNYDFISCFWDIETAGLDSSAGGAGKITAEMFTRTTFEEADWDFDTVWCINEGIDYPRLQALDSCNFGTDVIEERDNFEATLSVFPNPFSDRATISYALDKPAFTFIHIYNAFGGKIKTINEEYKTAGEHSAVFDAGDYPPGIYYYTVQSGSVSSSGKMILIR